MVPERLEATLDTLRGMDAANDEPDEDDCERNEEKTPFEDDAVLSDMSIKLLKVAFGTCSFLMGWRHTLLYHQGMATPSSTTHPEGIFCLGAIPDIAKCPSARQTGVTCRE